MILIRLTKEELQNLLDGKVSVVREIEVEEYGERVGICCAEPYEMSLIEFRDIDIPEGTEKRLGVVDNILSPIEGE